MLDDMKVIGHDASPRQAQLDGSPEGLAHIHAHRFHPLAVGEPLEQTHDIVLLTASTHLEDLAGVEVAGSCRSAVPCAGQTHQSLESVESATACPPGRSSRAWPTGCWPRSPHSLARTVDPPRTRG